MATNKLSGKGGRIQLTNFESNYTLRVKITEKGLDCHFITTLTYIAYQIFYFKLKFKHFKIVLPITFVVTHSHVDIENEF